MYYVGGAVPKGKDMANIERMLKQLRKERVKAARELATLDGAISALENVVGRNSRAPRRGARARRKMSAAARKRISAAQKARWAKLRAGKKAAA